MADIEPGNPQTLKADEAARQEWQAESPNMELTFARPVAAKAARLARIEQFEQKQRHRRNFVSLHEVFGWLSDCDDAQNATASKRIDIICRAFSETKSVFRIGGDLLPWAVIVQPDYSPPISMGFASDIAAVRNRSLYPDSRAVRALIERLWVPRDLLLKLFQERGWSARPWLQPADDRIRDETSLREEPTIPASRRLSFVQKREIFQNWRDSCSHIPSEDEDCDAMLKHGIRRAAVRKLRRHFPTKPRGKPKRSIAP